MLPPARAQEPDDGEVAGRLFVPPPRELSRPLTRTREAIAAGEFRQAVDLLGQLLADTSFEDYLLVDDDEPALARSIQLTARELLGQVPESWLSDYELRYSVSARQMLEQAVAQGDYSQLARVSRHYFYTPAGQSATMLLGHYFLESGEVVSAGRCFSQIVATPAAQRRHDPDASLSLAICQVLAGSSDRAARTLTELAARTGDQPVVFQGQSIRMFGDPDQALAWLTKLTGDAPLPVSATVDEWLMFRGDPARNAAHGTGIPLVQPRWQVPALNDPVQESIAGQVFQSLRQSGEPLVPSLQPLAAGNTVVIRSLNRLIGIDFETGKRIWEFPAWLPDSLATGSEQAITNREDQISDWHVRQRIWQDHLYGQMSSNGRDVYFVDQPGYTGGAGGRIVIERGLSIVDPLGGRESNELKCLDLVRQGAFRWDTGGRDGGSEPALAGCFFLGAPVPGRNGELYAICELDGEIRVVALDQETGRLIWTQQIASIDTIPPIGRDPIRRLAAASPSLASGVLVCPTSATGLVAIDLATRSLLWGARYPRLPDASGERDSVLRRQPLPRDELSGFESRSVDSTVTIAGDRVIVAPVESDRILCFDLMSGRSLWQGEDDQPGQPREDGLYVACVHDQTVVIAGQSNMRGMDIQTGALLWSVSLARYGEPGGRGFLARGHYFLPTSKSLIVELDIRQGAIVGSANTRQLPGNLICHRGDVISQNHDLVSVYHQVEPLRQRLANVPPGDMDVYGKCLRARILAHDGQLAEAVSLAGQAWQNTPEPISEKVLTELILQWLMADYVAARPVADQYSELLQRTAPEEFWTACLRGAIEANEIRTALDLIVSSTGTLATAGMRAPRTVLGDHRTVLEPEQALKFQLRNSGRVDLPDPGQQHPQISRWLADHRDRLTPDQLQRLMDWTGSDFFQPAELLTLAESRIRQGATLAGEQTLAEILRRTESGPAAVAMCRLLRDAGWDRAAIELAQSISSRFPDQILQDPGGEFPARDLADRWFPGAVTARGWKNWNYGAAKTRLETTDDRQPLHYRMIIHPECVALTGTPVEEVHVQIDVNEAQVVVHDRLGNEIGRVRYGNPQDHQRYQASRMASGRYALHGHLLIVGYGYDLIAVDLYRLKAGETSPLWHRTLHNETGFRESILLNSGVGARPIDNPWGIQRFQIVGRDGNAIGMFASNGRSVWYLIGDSLHCVDAMTGTLRWQRTNVVPNSHIAAGPRAVYLMAPVESGNRSTRFDAVEMLDAEFGTLLNEIRLDPAAQTLWQTLGDTAVFTRAEGRENVLTGIDLQTGQGTWEYRCQRGSLGCFRDPATMAIYHSDGILEYLDLRDGEIRRRINLEPLSGKTIHVHRLDDHDLVRIGLDQETATARSIQPNRTIRATSNLEPLFDGYLFCIDLQVDLPRWPTAVRIEHFSIPADQPADLPLMTLSRIVNNHSEPRAGMSPEFFTIDLRDGRLVSICRQDNLSFGTFDVHGDPETQTAEVRFGDQRLVIRLTGEAMPPTAPASLVNAFTMVRATDQGDSVETVQDPLRRQQEIIRQLIRQSAEPDTTVDK